MSLNKNTGILIDRAINELRTGRPIVLEEKGNYWIFYNLEHAKKIVINKFKKILRWKIKKNHNFNCLT